MELQRKIHAQQSVLAVDAVHVWRTRFSRLNSLADELRTLLTQDELERAARFRFPELRRSYVVGRALLRIILGAYCSRNPGDLRFSYDRFQKPWIETHGAESLNLSFNVSHSGDALCMAVAGCAKVGIDVEDLSRRHNVDGLLAECLTDGEARIVSPLSHAQRQAAFFRYWVHKEAFLKCLGCGFSVPPKEVEVSFGDNGRSVMRSANPLANEVLFGRDLSGEPGYAAAVATAEQEYIVQTSVL